MILLDTDVLIDGADAEAGGDLHGAAEVVEVLAELRVLCEAAGLEVGEVDELEGAGGADHHEPEAVVGDLLRYLIELGVGHLGHGGPAGEGRL